MKKFIERVIAVALFVALSVMMAGCGATSETNTVKGDSVEDYDDYDDYDDDEDYYDDDDYDEDGEDSCWNVEAEEQVLVDQNDIKITLLGIEASEEQACVEVTFKFENNTDKNVGFQVTSMLNGFALQEEFFMNVTVLPGAEKEDFIFLMTESLLDAGVEYVGELEFIFYVYQTEEESCYCEEEEFYFKTEPVFVKTTHYDKMDSEPSMLETAEEIFNQDGVRIWARYNDTTYDGKYKPHIMFYVKNESEADVEIYRQELGLNGQKIMFGSDVLGAGSPLAGKKWIGELEIRESDMEDAGITTLEDIQFSVSVDNESNNEYYCTDVITIKVK